MNYYKVLAKCGHVGRNNFILKAFYVKAEDGREAARDVRNKGRVKHNQKFAIKLVEKISLEDYSVGCKMMAEDSYFKAHSKQEQIILKAVDPKDIMREPEKEKKYKKRRNGQRIKYYALLKETNKQIWEAFYE